MAKTRVLNQLTDGDRTTSDGKLFHNVTVARIKRLLFAQLIFHNIWTKFETRVGSRNLLFVLNTKKMKKTVYRQVVPHYTKLVLSCLDNRQTSKESSLQMI